MDSRKLGKIRREINAARRRANRHRERIVRSLGRERLKGASARGKEPTYESTAFPKANMITIPDHGGRTLGPGTQAKILDQIEEDVDRWEAKLEQDQRLTIRGNGYGK